ncbi:LysE family translocator [Paenibacillus sinopodophylli]|uniref:LysE family translocator n=1 Tax=Paenibacillus sinopodophylli TaxID=1837342 RepID=UPI00110D0514|nr:LysE family transporter [Paenibacillus sinopodophylli]
MDVTSFLIYCMIATITPGPTNMVILSTVYHLGAKEAMKYTYGATVGFALLLVISAALNNLLVTIIPKIVILMQIIGSMYMFYLIYQIYKKDITHPAVNQESILISGFLMQFLNPKVILFAVTVIPSFIMPHYNGIHAMTISIIVISLIGFSAFTTWVLFGALFKTFLQKHDTIVNVTMSLFLAYAALIIWL